MSRRVMLFGLLVSVACSGQAPPARPGITSVVSLKDLLDSLVAESPCPRAGLPPIVGGAEFDSLIRCSLATAALRRLAHEPAMEPRHAPGDTAQVDTITIMLQAWPMRDSAWNVVGIPDTVIQVQLDVRGRPRFFIAYYWLGPSQSIREQFGLIHR